MATMFTRDGLRITVAPATFPSGALRGDRLRFTIAGPEDTFSGLFSKDDATMLGLIVSAEADNLGPSANLYRPENRPIKINQ